LTEIAQLVADHHATSPDAAFYAVSPTGNTFLASLLNRIYTDYVFGLTSIGELEFGAGYTVQSDKSINMFQHLFSTTDSRLNVWMWMLVQKFLSSIPATSQVNTNTVRFLFHDWNTDMLSWFQQKASSTVSIGKQYPDVLRSFLLRSPINGWYETVSTYSAIKAYSTLAQVPVFKL
jgi:hypothetical protein